MKELINLDELYVITEHSCLNYLGNTYNHVIRSDLYNDGVTYPCFDSFKKAHDYVDKRIGEGKGRWVAGDVMKLTYKDNYDSGWFDQFDDEDCYVEFTITRISMVKSF